MNWPTRARSPDQDILDEPELNPDKEIAPPDLAGWRRERMPGFPDTAGFGPIPDCVQEGPSSATRRFDLHGKRPAHARERVARLWFVDPTDRTPEVFKLRVGRGYRL